MQQGVIEGYRLSPQQAELWRLQQVEPAQPYRAQCAVLIEGELNKGALAQVVQRVVQRYEVLRTAFQFLPGMTLPLQVIAQPNLAWDQGCDLSDLDLQRQKAKIELLFQEVSQRPFDQIGRASCRERV